MSFTPATPLSVVILAAGKGKRMNNPDLAKVMVKLGDVPLIGHVLNTANSLKPEKIIIVVGHQRQNVVDYVITLGLKNTSFAVQEEQLGTGHAVNQTSEILKNYKGNILILSGDVPLLTNKTLRNFILKHQGSGAHLSVLSAFTDYPSGYGRIIRNTAGDFLRITEEKDATEDEKKIKEINSGIYLVNPEYLYPALLKLSNDNAQGEYYLTDVVSIFIRKKLKVGAYPLAGFDELQGINSPDELRKAEDYFYSQNS